MDTATKIAALGAFAFVAALIFGRLWDNIVLEFLLRISVFTFICLVIYIVFGLIGYSFEPPTDLAARVDKAQGWATAGLVIAVIVTTGLGVLVGKGEGSSEPGKRRGAIFTPALWLWFCFASLIGHIAGGWVGLLTITVPAVLVFWLFLHYLARFILPLNEDQPVSTALRCLLTFSAGTNYPYYVLEDREKVERVPGNQFKKRLFDLGPFGPGIFLTGPDHVVAVSDGLKFKGVRGPGVVFTYLFESIQEPMDLRPQQRMYTVDAITKDGIPVRVNTFGPFQLDAGEQQPKTGKNFPFRARSVFMAFHAQPVDVQRGKLQGEVVEERKRRRWDELYKLIGTHVMQDIIAQYKFDELCEPLNPDKDPRKDIVKKYQDRMRRELPNYGIRIPGGGISNLLPADKDAVLKRRAMNWQTQWQRKMLERRGLAEAEAERLIGQTRAQVQVEMIQNISEAIAEVTTDDREGIFNMIALRFIESLNQMIAQPQLTERLPADATEVVHKMAHIIGEG
jgi:regulator of protease activity HflC (stomatin/prohibitin superfamily)